MENKHANSARIIVTPRFDITPEQARDARARALRYALDCYFEKQKAAGEDGGEDARKEDQHASGEASMPSPFLNRNTDSLPPERPDK